MSKISFYPEKGRKTVYIHCDFEKPAAKVPGAQIMKSLRGLRSIMRIVVETRGGKEHMEMPEDASPLEVLSRLCLLPDAHIILRGGVPIPIDERLTDGDVLKIIKVASGG